MEIESKESGVIEDMFKVGAHFAYSKSRRHPTAKPYIFGAKNRVEIFDLEKTKTELDKAKDFIRSIVENGGQVLLVASKHEARDAVRDRAQSVEMPYVAGRWVGGTLTNFSEIKKRIDRLVDHLEKREKGEFGKYTKKERLLIDREIENLRELFWGLVPMKDLPKVLFVVDSRKEHIAVTEASKMGIPVVSLSSSDCDLRLVTHAIPGNDTSRASISFFVGEIAKAIEEGKTRRKVEQK